jgi:hypothetical protein
MGKRRLFHAMTALALCALPVCAQWVKQTHPIIPDSLRILASQTIPVGGDVETDAILTAKDDSTYILGAGPSWNKGYSLGGVEVSAVSILDGSCLVGTSQGLLFIKAGCTGDWFYGQPVRSGVAIRSFILGDGKIFVGTTKGVYKSTWLPSYDWAAFNAGLTDSSILKLVSRGDKLYAVTEGRVFASSINGTSWTALSPIASNVRIRDVVESGGRLFAATDSGVYRSMDSGVSWTAFSTGLGSKSAYALLDTSSNIFVGTGDGVYRTTVNASGWTKVDSGMTAGAVYALGHTKLRVYAGKDDGLWSRMIFQIVPVMDGRPGKMLGRFGLSSHAASFTLPVASRVTLEAFSPDGKRAALLLSEEFPAGEHTRRIHTESLRNGLYIYRLRAGDLVETRKVMRTR